MHIVVVGDPDCGKTSTVFGLSGETAPEFKPIEVHESVLYYSQIARTQLIFHDTSYDLDDANLECANLILLVSDATTADCQEFDEPDETEENDGYIYWLDQFRAKGVKCPIILGLNKLDLLDDALRKAVQKPYKKKGILKFPFMAAVPYSAKNLDSCIHLRNTIEKHIRLAMDSPSHLLVDYKPDFEITTGLRRAIRRCFRALDKDADGALNPNEFQEFCHQSGISDKFSKVVRDCQSQGMEFVQEGGISEVGFVFYMENVAYRREFNHIWDLLKSHSYTKEQEELKIEEDDFPLLDYSIEYDQIFEFTNEAFEILDETFTAFDSKDFDFAAVTPQCLNEILDILPEELESDLPSKLHEFECVNEFSLTLDGWLAYWASCLDENPERTIKQLCYFDRDSESSDPKNWIKKSSTKRVDKNAKSVGRNVMHALVFGPEQCGKTWFCNQLACKPCSEGVMTDSLQTTYGRVHLEENGYKFLKLTEVPMNPDLLMKAMELIPKVDLILLLYDSKDSRSFCELEELYEVLPKDHNLPVFCISCKHVSLPVGQYKPDSGEAYNVIETLQSWGIQEEQQQIHISLTDDDDKIEFEALFDFLFNLGQSPDQARLKIEKVSTGRKIKRALIIIGGIAVLAYAAYYTYKVFSSDPAPKVPKVNIKPPAPKPIPIPAPKKKTRFNWFKKD